MTSSIKTVFSLGLGSFIFSRLHHRIARDVVPIALITMLVQGCARAPTREPVTLVYLDQRLVNPQYQAEYEQEFQQFTRETGIRVKNLPHPESTQDQLTLWRKLLRSGSSGPDVYGIDVVWAGILSEDFIDLKPYFGDEISAFFPAVINTYTANNKLVAIPQGSDIGLLFYRSDLLRKYGYKGPPETWDELEAMAARIQAGERAKGKKGFWGFVWPGAPTEALTCAALEWQASEGGGRIIEDNKTVSVDNPRAILAWQRATRWVGSISPQSVLVYNEGDASNVWYTGDAAFLRNWPTFYVLARQPGSATAGKVGVALLPGGEGGQLGTSGGIGLGVSRYSAHPREAIALVRFLSRSDMAIRRARLLSDPPSRPDLYNLPEVLGPNPHFALLSQAFRTGIVSRPSNVSGAKYDEVSNAYIKAVHSVLRREQTAPRAAAALEKELSRITGYNTGLPLESSPRLREKGASAR